MLSARPSIMHRHHQQRPHRNRAAASNHPNLPATTTTTTTTPPSMKSPYLHRRVCSSLSSPSSSVVAPKGSSSSAITSLRPPIHRRTDLSAHYTPVHLNHHKRTHPRRLLEAASGPASQIVPEDDAQIEMAASFLQFCAMCEKQIMVPSNSVLYCSESCRRKDSCKPLSASTYTMTSSSPVNINININHNHNHNLDQAGSPFSSTSTCRVSRSSRPLVSIPCDLHDAKSDLDPTEWKPIISRSRGRSSGRTSSSLASSEAWLFLSQFHHHCPSPADDESTKSISSSTPSSSSASTMHAVLPVRRSPTSRTSSNFSSSSLSTMMSTTPSLVNTPTTITASSSVTGSPPQSLLSASSPPCPVSAVDYIGAGTAYGYGYGYAWTGFDLNPSKAMHPARPLPPRHNPSFSTSGAGASKGVHLVVPHIVTSAPVADDRHVGTADADDDDDVDVDDDVHGLRDEGVWMTM